MQKLGLVAGAGALPAQIAKLAQAKGLTPIIVTLEGHDHADFSPLSTQSFGLTQIESIIGHFKTQNVSDIVMVGKVERPVITPQTPIDATSAKLLQETLPHGDDAALRAILQVVQQAGLRVLPVAMLVPDQKLPADYDNEVGLPLSNESLSLAIKAHKRLSPLDVGQAIFVQNKRVIAIEAAEGTDEMIKRAAGLLMPEGIKLFFKASKVTQNKLLDPPVIGLDTIKHCIAAAVDVIAIEAEHCLLAAPLPQIEALCASHNIRLVSVTIYEGDA